MKRRAFLSVLGGAISAWPLAARAQQNGQMRRIGVLIANAESDPQAVEGVAAFKAALAELGWIDGRNIRIDYRAGLDATIDWLRSCPRSASAVKDG